MCVCAPIYQASSSHASRFGPPQRHMLQSWVPHMAYELFGDKASFEKLVRDAKADNCVLGCLSALLIAAACVDRQRQLQIVVDGSR